jgi:glutamyl-tRNA reductase
MPPEEKQPAAPAALFVVGANHRSAPLALRDRLFFDEAGHAELLRRLKQRGLAQAIALSTCDRVEVQGAAPDPEAAMRWVLEEIARGGGMDAASVDREFYRLTGDKALRHVLAVAASLDSLVIGEPQVLGQVKASHRLSETMGLSGPEIDTVLQAAYAAAKRVRSETRVAEGPVSLAAAAAQVARDLHGDLDQISCLVVGLGDMGLVLAGHFMQAGARRMTIAASSPARAEAAARPLGCNHAGLDKLGDLLAAADVTISAQGAGGFTLAAKDARAAIARRRQKPILMIDAAIPADLAPDIDEVDGAFRYDLDALERLAIKGRSTREAAAKDAWRILDEELESFRRGRAERRAAPALSALRQRFEAERERLLAETPGIDAAEATRLLVNRLLHDPSEVLRAIAAEGGTREETEALLRRLFRLSGEEK